MNWCYMSCWLTDRRRETCIHRSWMTALRDSAETSLLSFSWHFFSSLPLFLVLPIFLIFPSIIPISPLLFTSSRSVSLKASVHTNRGSYLCYPRLGRHSWTSLLRLLQRATKNVSFLQQEVTSRHPGAMDVWRVPCTSLEQGPPSFPWKLLSGTWSQ